MKGHKNRINSETGCCVAREREREGIWTHGGLFTVWCYTCNEQEFNDMKETLFSPNLSWIHSSQTFLNYGNLLTFTYPQFDSEDNQPVRMHSQSAVSCFVLGWFPLCENFVASHSNAALSFITAVLQSSLLSPTCINTHTYRQHTQGWFIWKC